MNYGQEFLAKDEIELSIERIIRTCIKKAKWIIVCAVLFAVLLSGFMYAKSSGQQGADVSPESLLTEDERITVDNYVFSHNSLKYYQKYKNQSPLMQLNFNEVYQTTLQYYVKAEESVKMDVTGALASERSQELLSEMFCQELGITETDFAAEVYTVEFAKKSSEHALKTTIEITLDILDNSSVFVIHVMADTEEDCNKYTDTLKKLLAAQSEDLKSSVGTHELVLLDEKSFFGFDQTVFDVQNTYYTDLAELQKSMTTLKNSMTDLQKLAVMNLCDAKLALIDTQGKGTLFEVKYAVLGAGIGAVLGIMLITVYVLFDGKLQSEKELAKRLQAVHLGTVDKKCKQENLEMMCIRIQKSLEAEDKNRIDFISTSDALSNPCVQKLCGLLREKNIQVNLIGNVINQKDSLAELSKSDPVLLVETIGKTVLRDAYQEAGICGDMGVEMLGYVCIVE